MCNACKNGSLRTAGIEGRVEKAGLNLLRIVIGVAIAWLGPVSLCADDSFETRLRSPVKIIRPAGEISEIFASISASQNIAIQFDPRVDPHQIADVPSGQMPLLPLCEFVSGYAGAASRPIGETVLITPLVDADRIATLARLRQSELTDGPATRARLRLFRRFDLSPELQPATPNELLALIAKKSGLTIAGDPLEHDLWFVDLKQVSPAEALAFVLVPMGSTFEWTDENGIAIRSIDDSVIAAPLTVRERHGIPRKFGEGAVRVFLESILGERLDSAAIEIDMRRRVVTFSGTAMDHDRFVQMLEPPPAPKEVDPSLKRYTLNVVSKPAGAVLDSLAAQGIPLTYDAAFLRAAGIEVDQAITFSVNQVTAAELIETLAGAIGATTETTNGTTAIVPR